MNMKLLDILEGMGEISYTEVYRGEEHEHIGKSIWVSEDEEFASEYGKVTKYLMPSNLNILNVEYNYSEWEDLIDSFDPVTDPEEYMYEPTHELIEFLKTQGYDGFENGDNILIFDKANLKKV